MGLSGFEERDIEELRREVKRFRGLVVNILEDQWGFKLYILNFHLLDHIVENTKRFGSLEMLHGSPLEKYNVHII